MAGDWIPIRIDIARSREVLIIAARTGWSPYEVVGRLIEFWGWVSSETADGTIPGLTVEALARLGTFDPQFLSAMLEVGWLVETDTGLEIPRFDRWLSQSAKKRLQDAGRQRRARAQQLLESDRECHARVTKMSRSQRDKRVTDVTKMSRSERDKSVTTEQNRIEEKRTEQDRREQDIDISDRIALIDSSPRDKNNSVCDYDVIDCPESKRGEAVDDSSPPAPSELQDLVYPCKGPVKEWAIPPSLYRDLVALYPDVDVLGELRKARAWIITNPTRRKTARGMPRFLNSWLARAVDSPRHTRHNGEIDLEDLF